jgi:hypothetical protein
MVAGAMKAEEENTFKRCFEIESMSFFLEEYEKKALAHVDH